MGGSSSVPKPDNWIEAPHVPDIPVHKLIFDRVEANLQRFGDGVWLKLADSKKEMKFSEVIPKIKTLASALTRRGFKKGDFVVFNVGNKLDYFLMVIAVWTCGGTVSLLDFETLADKVAKVANDLEATFIVCDKRTYGRAAQAKELSRTVQSIISLDDDVEHCIRIKELYEEDGTACPTNVDIDSHNDLAYVPYSSGTTGLPKGIMHTYRTMTILFYHAMRSNIPPLKYLVRNSNFHISGFTGFIGALVMHFPIVGLEYPNEELFLRSIATEKPTIVYGYISNIVRIMKYLDLSKYDLSSVRVLGITGSQIHPDWEERLRERLPNLKRFVQGYGLTEMFMATGVDFLQPAETAVKGSVGRPLIFSEIEVRDPVTLEPLPTGQIGELWIKSAMMMKGYWKNPEATAAALVDGWYRSGDLGYMNEDRDVFFVERIKELIKFDNHHVVPKAIESLLLLHPAVADAAVVGKPDEIYGELPVAFVVKKEGAKASEEDIFTFVNERVSANERIRGGVVFIDSIPRNHLGKIIRRDLVEMLQGNHLYDKLIFKYTLIV